MNTQQQISYSVYFNFNGASTSPFAACSVNNKGREKESQNSHPVSKLILGNLRSYDGDCNENVTIKLNFALSLLQLFHVDHVVQNRRTAISLAWHEWFSCKGKEWKIYCCELALWSEPQIWKFHVVVWQTTSKHCTKKRAARAARLFFFIQPITDHWFVWRCRWHCLRQILNSQTIKQRKHQEIVLMKRIITSLLL